MKQLLIILFMLLSGCSTLGFGEFNVQKKDINNKEKFDSNKSNQHQVSIKFVYQPLTGGKHEVYLAGDFI